MGEDAGKWISRVSHQLKRQMSYEEDAEEERELTNMQKHILHFILFFILFFIPNPGPVIHSCTPTFQSMLWHTVSGTQSPILG